MSKQPQAYSGWIQAGAACWVWKQSEYFAGCVVSADVNQSKATISLIDSDEQIEVAYSLLLERDSTTAAQSDHQDMVHMPHLNEGEILDNLRRRYQRNEIYTYIGPTLIVMNPYKEVTSSSNVNLMEQVKRELGISVNVPLDYRYSQSVSTTAHTFAVSGIAYKQMFSNSKNQAIVISGESGAGKTENAKASMQFLTSLSSSDGQASMISSLRCKLTSELLEEFNQFAIEVKILACNPILEAFGNAKTVRNNNSSRFGKYVKIYIDRISHKIQGASIENYLLEKSRITTPAKGERNYHIFYHLLKGCTEITSLFKHKSPQGQILASDFEYLKRSECFAVENLSDAKLYLEVKRSLKQMNFTVKDQEAIFSVLSAILLLGNSQPQQSQVKDSNAFSFLASKEFLNACELLQVNPKKLDDSLVLKIRKVGTTVIESPMQLVECISIRDSLSKNLYDNLFNFLVRKLNEGLLPPPAIRTTCLSIGLLDIFGFESFDVNSFEQLCINFTNERLQQLYVQYIFKSEEVDYMSEGITGVFADLHYQENQLIIDLIEKKPTGILVLLDESCSLASSNDEAYLNSIIKNHGKNTLCSFPKKDKFSFSLSHTAKSVVYTVTGFREKNKDEVSLELEGCMEQSTNSVVASLFKQSEKPQDISQQQQRSSLFKSGANSASAVKKPSRYLGQKFRQSLAELMSELTSSDVHFIRCIKPNEEKRADHFDYSFIFQQVQYQGLLDSIKIRRFGYAHRMTYEAFFLEFQELGESTKKLTLAKINKMNLELADLIKNGIFVDTKLLSIAKLPDNSVAFGKSKIFLKSELMKHLNKCINQVLKQRSQSAQQIIVSFRKYLFRKHFKSHLNAIKKKVIKLQAVMRMLIRRRKYLKVRKSLRIFARFARNKLLARAIQSLKQNVFAKVTTKLAQLLYQKTFFAEIFLTLKQLPKGYNKTSAISDENNNLPQPIAAVVQKQQFLKEPEIKQEQLDLQRVSSKEIKLPNETSVLTKEIKNRVIPPPNSQKKVDTQKTIDKEILLKSGCLDIIQEMNEEPRNKEAQSSGGVIRNSIKVVPIINFNAGRPMSKAWRSTLLRGSRIPNTIVEVVPAKKQKKKGPALIETFTEKNPVSRFGEYHEIEAIDLDEIEQSDDSELVLSESVLSSIHRYEYAAFLPQVIVRRTKWGVKQTPEKLMLHQTKPISSSLSAITDLPRIATGEDMRDAIDFIRSIAQQNALNQLAMTQSVVREVPEKFEEISLLLSQSASILPKSKVEVVQNPKKAVGRDMSLLDKSNSIVYQKKATFPYPIAVIVSNLKKSPSDKAVTAFKCLLKCSGERKSRFSRHTNMAKLLAICSENSSEMREEVYLHLCKQLTSNPQSESRLKYLRIFGILSSFLPTTARFFYPLLNFLYSRCSVSDSIEGEEEQKWYKFCLMRLLRGDQIQRACLPSDTEIVMIENMKKVMLRVYLMNGVPISIGVESYTSVAQLKTQILNNLGIDSQQSCYGLMEVRWNSARKIQESRFIDENERIMDVIAFWDTEQIAANSNQPSKLIKNSSSIATDFYVQNYKELTGLQVQLGIRVFFHLEESDTTSISAFYAQTYAEVQRNKYVILEEHDYLNLAALQLIIDYPHKMILRAIHQLLELIGDEPSLFIPEEPSPITRKIQKAKSSASNQGNTHSSNINKYDSENELLDEDDENGERSYSQSNRGDGNYDEEDEDGDDLDSSSAYRAFVEDRQSEESLSFDPSFYIPELIFDRREPNEWKDVILSTLHKNHLFKGKRTYSAHQAKLAYIIYLSKQDLFMSTTFRDVKYSRIKLTSLNDTISSLEKYEKMVVDQQAQNQENSDEVLLAINPSNILICDSFGMQRPKRRVQISHILKYCCTEKEVIVVSKENVKHIFETPAYCNEITYLIRQYLKVFIENLTKSQTN